jgi:HTH-type transcriptional regulator/antitoxin HigA
MIELKPIKNDEQYEVEWVDEQFDHKPTPDSPESDMLQIALLLIKAYEDVHFQNG